MTPELPRHVLKWPDDAVAMAFRLIPAGDFLMGSRGYNYDEEPVHRVRIVGDFWMAETPVTQAQFGLWTVAEKVEHKNHFDGHPDHPAESMDWRQAAAYCSWLGRVKPAEMPEGFTLACLPAEAEWEYACRARTETDYHTGDGEAALAKTGWFGEDWGNGSTHPVRQKIPNLFGLHDMHGNVSEWCRDVYDARAYRKRLDAWAGREWTLLHAGRDAQYWGIEDRRHTRVLRGGSWFDSAVICRSANRFGIASDVRYSYFGFRVCLVCGPADGRGAPGTDPAEAGTAPGDAGRGTRPELDGASPAGAGKAGTHGTHRKGGKPADHADHAEGESPDPGPAGAVGRREHGRPDAR